MLIPRLIVGADAYGRVKTVEGTPVVTTFAMFHFLPLYPKQSFYWIGVLKPQASSLPILFSEHDVEIEGIPLARRNGVSVAFGYLRAAAAALILIGSLAIVPGYTLLTGGRLDEFGRLFAIVLLSSLGVGIALGALSYLVPTNSRREYAIRARCAELIDLAIDPALVVPEYASQLNDELDRLEETIRSVPASTFETERSSFLLELVRARCAIALGEDRPTLESRTDELLDQLQRAEPAAM